MSAELDPETAVAIERAQLYEERKVKLEIEEELRIARTVQEFFSPRKSLISGSFRVAGANFPSLEVSGDYYDFFPSMNRLIAFAIAEFGLPANLKLSVHSGSDKFSIYPAIRAAIRRTGAGLHIKTAGTTWLEELIGLASAGGDGLQIAKDVYGQALGRFDELCGPYATVIDIDKAKLPSPAEVATWDGDRYARTLRHDQSSPHYNPHVRQLLHVGYKVAAQMGERYTGALVAHRAVVAQNVTENLFDRHLKRVFIGD